MLPVTPQVTRAFHPTRAPPRSSLALLGPPRPPPRRPPPRSPTLSSLHTVAGRSRQTSGLAHASSVSRLRRFASFMDTPRSSHSYLPPRDPLSSRLSPVVERAAEHASRAHVCRALTHTPTRRAPRTLYLGHSERLGLASPERLAGTTNANDGGPD